MKDGGPAFPVPACFDPTRERVVLATELFDAGGMSLRDYFAGKAMQAAFAGEGARMVANRDERYDETNWAQVVAVNAYEMADAMLAERQKNGGES